MTNLTDERQYAADIQCQWDRYLVPQNVLLVKFLIYLWHICTGHFNVCFVCFVFFQEVQKHVIDMVEI